MIETLQIVLAAIASLITLGIFIYRLRRTPPLASKPSAAAHSTQWRWRQPAAEFGFQLRDDAQKSTLLLPETLMPFETACVFLGYFGVCLVLLYFATRLYLQVSFPEFLAGFGLAGLVFGMLHVGMRVSAITLYQDRLIVTCRWGFFFEHQVIFKRSATLSFSTETHFFQTLHYEENTAFFVLFIKKSRFSRRERFIVSINPQQGTWLLTCLTDWLAYIR